MSITEGGVKPLRPIAEERPAATVKAVLNMWFWHLCNYSEQVPGMLETAQAEYDMARHALAELDPSV